MRVAIAVALILACLALDVTLRFHNTKAVLKWRGRGDHVSRAAQRFEEIRPQLPHQGVVGYRFQGEQSSVVAGTMLPQYYLAPLIVQPATRQKIVLDDDGTTVRWRQIGSYETDTPTVKLTTPNFEKSIFIFVLMLGLPCFSCFLFLFRLCRRSQEPRCDWATTLWLLGMSWGIGLSISSALFAFWNFFCGPPNSYYIVLELVVWAGLCMIRFRRATSPQPTPLCEPIISESPKIVLPLVSLLFVLLAVTLWECTVWNERCPHGINDAVMIWNLRARFLIRSPGDWACAFSPLIWHSDYPLLLPATIARAWYFFGSEWPGVAAIVGNLFYSFLVLVLVSSLWMIRGMTAGCLMGLILLSATDPLMQAISQIADLPFAYYVASMVTAWVVALRQKADAFTAWLCVGLSLGAGFWLKNEGLTWAAAAVATVIIMDMFSRRSGTPIVKWRAIGAGMVIFVVAWGLFRYLFPTVNDLVAGQGATTLAKLTTPERYGQILAFSGMQALLVGPGLLPILCIYAVLMGINPATRRDYGVYAPVVVICLQGLAYFLVYLTSPNDLKWHLETSAERLLVHLWPTLVWLLLCVVRTPAERAEFDRVRILEHTDFESQMQHG